MYNIVSIRKGIDKLGNNLSNCPNSCRGVINAKKQGVFPRCLILEDKKNNQSIRNIAKGCIVVGLNPGSADEKEKSHMKNSLRMNKYDAWIDFFWKNHYKKKYYENARQVLNHLGIRGPILWTELVKCESKSPRTLTLENGEPWEFDQAYIPLQTIQTCTEKYLFNEIEFLTRSLANWTIIANGKRVFGELCIRPEFDDKTILGIHHTSGSKKNYSKYIRGIPKYRRITGHVWFGVESGKVKSIEVK